MKVKVHSATQNGHDGDKMGTGSVVFERTIFLIHRLKLGLFSQVLFLIHDQIAAQLAAGPLLKVWQVAHWKKKLTCK